MSIIAQLLSRKHISLTNRLDRYYVQQLITNADTLQAELATWRPLFAMTAVERVILASLTEDSTLRDVLARLPLHLGSYLEQRLLAEDIAAYGGPALPAPSNLSALAVSDTQNDLSWTDNATDETEIRVYCAVNGGGYSLIATLAADSTSYSHQNLSQTNTYTYLVRAYRSSDGKLSTASNTASAQPLPSTPSGLFPENIAPTQNDLAWDDLEDTTADEYIPERSLTGVGSWTALAAVATLSTSDTGLTEGTRYYYQVRGHRTSDGKSSAYSTIQSVVTKLVAPTNLVAAPDGSDTIDLTWTNSSTRETGTEIQRSLDGASNWEPVTTTAANATSYSDTGRTPGTTYYYRARNYRSGEEAYSDWSNIDSATTTGNAFDALVAPDISGGSLRHYYKMNEASGDIIDYGADPVNLPTANVAYNQSIATGDDNKAVDCNGSTSTMQSSGNIADLGVFTVYMFVNLDGKGEQSEGYLIDSDSVLRIRFNTDGTLDAQVFGAGAATSETVETMPLGEDQCVIATFDSGGDKKIRLYRLVDGVPVEFTYETQTAAGTVNTTPTALSIGNIRNASSRTTDGRISRTLIYNVVHDVEDDMLPRVEAYGFAATGGGGDDESYTPLETYYVAPSAAGAGDGSTISDPMTLATALAQAQAGDEYLLDDGDYVGLYTASSTGTEASPIVWRAINDNAVRFNGYFKVSAPWNWFWGLEGIKNESAPAGAAGEKLFETVGTNCSGVKWINCIGHNNDDDIGFGVWHSGTDQEMYGCIIGGNGGHGVYTQNRHSTDGTKTFELCAFYEPAKDTKFLLQAYGSSSSYLSDFLFKRCAMVGVLKNGNFLVGGRSNENQEWYVFDGGWVFNSTLRIGYDRPITTEVVNSVFRRAKLGCSYSFGYGDGDVAPVLYVNVQNNDFKHINNDFVGKFYIDYGSYIYESSVGTPESVPIRDEDIIDNNVYGTDAKFALKTNTYASGGGGISIADWRTNSGTSRHSSGVAFDANSTTVANPTTDEFWIAPFAKYEVGRLWNIMTNDADGNGSVNVDLSTDIDSGTVLENGDTYEIYNIRDIGVGATPVASGTYSGGTVALTADSNKSTIYRLIKTN